MGHMNNYRIIEVEVPAGEAPVWAVRATDTYWQRDVDIMLSRTRQGCEQYIAENNLSDEGDDE